MIEEYVSPSFQMAEKTSLLFLSLIFYLCCSLMSGVTASCSTCFVQTSDCTCISGRMSCVAKQLTAVPTLQVPCANMSHTQSYTFNMKANKISDLPASAFEKLQMANSDYINLYLSNNTISNIDDDAFKGIENKTIYLQLQTNKLTSIPSAIGKLTNLKVLSLSENNIQNFSSDVFSKIGNSVQILSFDLKGHHAWPAALDSMTALESVTISSMEDPNSLPKGAFANSSLLHSLQFYNGNFSNIPESFCDIANLSTLGMFFNEPMNDLNWPCQKPLSKLKSLTVAASNISTVPDIKTIGQNIERFALTRSNISSFSDVGASSTPSVKSFDLSDNKLVDFPTGVKQFPNLEQLIVANNKINHIPNSVFDSMDRLRALVISNNSVHTIDDDAFVGLTSLTWLDMKEDGFFEIPRAIEKLPNPNVRIDLSGNFISCDCTLKWLVNWISSSKAQILGSCLTGKSIMDYIANDLRTC